MSVTLITSLYDIGREAMKGKYSHRPFDLYLQWFERLLSLNMNMIVIVPKNLESFVLTKRNKDNTLIVIREFEDLAAYKYYPAMQAAIDKMRQHSPTLPRHFIDCPEFNNAKYETIIFSKIDFLKEFSLLNPFKSKYFFWLDAGTFRTSLTFNNNCNFDEYKCKLFDNKFLIPDISLNIHDKSPLFNKKEFLLTNRNDICTYMLGGSAEIIDRVHKLFWQQVNLILKEDVINNEQNIFHLMILEDPDLYFVYPRTRRFYHNVSDPTCDRMIPHELCIGNFINVDYPINPNVKLLTYASKEIREEALGYWLKSTQHYGYDYSLLGRDEDWKDFSLKTKACYYEILKCEHPIIVITDSTDFFITGSSYELERKFLSTNKNILVGSEMFLHYVKGKNSKEEVKKHFESIKRSEQAFPNGGFIAGKRDFILKYLKLHFDYADDQAAMIDTIFEKKLDVNIDYENVLIGNVPNYGMKNSLAINYFTFDAEKRRYTNLKEGTYPVMLHFPGKNFGPMYNFFKESNANLLAYINCKSWNYMYSLTTFIIILILLILFVILRKRKTYN